MLDGCEAPALSSNLDSWLYVSGCHSPINLTDDGTTLSSSTQVQQRQWLTDIQKAMLSDDRYGLADFSCPPQTNDDGSTSVTLRYFARHSRKNKFEKENRMLQLLEVDSIPQYLWPAAAPFAAWIATSPSARALLQGRHVLELGSGVGLCGLAASLHAATVVLSDMSLVSVAMLCLSAAAHRHQGAARVVATALKWGEDTEAVCDLKRQIGITAFDVVIGSDIFYFNSSLTSGMETARHALEEAYHPHTSPSSAASSKTPKWFLCSSVVRSERMESDIDDFPQRYGFAPHELEVEDAANGLKVYKWSYESSRNGQKHT